MNSARIRASVVSFSNSSKIFRKMLALSAIAQPITETVAFSIAHSICYFKHMFVPKRKNEKFKLKRLNAVQRVPASSQKIVDAFIYARKMRKFQ